jgi:hypothetical protein
MFYYERFFQTALAGIDRSSIMPISIHVGQVILLISFLVAVYESFVRGGDVRMLGVAAVKYLGVGLILLSYGTAFREINGVFNAFADFIANNTSGGVDFFSNWINDLGSYVDSGGYETFWPLLLGSTAGIIGAVFVLVSYAIFPLTYAAFCFFYSFYGAILYVIGPLVISLLPSMGVGPLARVYIVNLMTFHFWGVIYSILGALIAAVNLSTVRDVITTGGFLEGFVGLEEALLLGIASLFYSISIAVIPFLATRIVRGEVFGTIANVIVSKIPLISARRSS